MKKITGVYWFFISIFFLTLLIPTNVHAQFDVWVEAPTIFTIAKIESVNVYIKNKDVVDENYNVTYTKSTAPPGGEYLINVYLPVNRTKTIKPDDVTSVLARVTLLGPVAGGSIRFTVDSDSGASFTTPQTLLITGPPINLPEFGLIGLIQLLILASLLLVVSYSSHFR